MSVLFVIFYIFSVAGMYLFGGMSKIDFQKVLRDPSVPDNYYMDNFNDLFSSLVTLYTLMVVNNWMV